MLKILLVETTPIKNNSDVVVHLRNSHILFNFLKQQHNCRLISDDSGIPDFNEQFDYIIYISATFYFKFENFVKLMDNQKNCKIGWISNEHDLFMQNFLKQYGIDFMICNFEEWGVKKSHKIYDKFLMTNLNTLIAKPRNEPCDKKHDIIFYGTWRKWREKYYKKYFVDDFILSTSGKNVKKFLIAGCDCNVTDRLSWESNKETLNLFKASLYIEDVVNHKLYNHLANRLYEALFCNCMVLFDRTCINTVKRSGYEIDDYFIIDNPKEIPDKIKNIDKDLLENFLVKNTDKALKDKEICFKEVEQFLINY